MVCKLYFSKAVKVTKMQTTSGKIITFGFTLFINNVNCLIDIKK